MMAVDLLALTLRDLLAPLHLFTVQLSLQTEFRKTRLEK